MAGPGPAHLSGGSAGARCGLSCSSSRGCSGSAGEDSGAASQPPADGRRASWSQPLQSPRTQRGDGFGAKLLLLHSELSTPRSLPAQPTSRPPHGQPTRLVQSPPRLPPQVLPPQCPSSLRPSSSDDESKSWTDPESPVHPRQVQVGAHGPEGTVCSRSDDELTQSPVFYSRPGGQLLPRLVTPVSALKTPQPLIFPGNAPFNSGLRLECHLPAVPPATVTGLGWGHVIP